MNSAQGDLLYRHWLTRRPSTCVQKGIHRYAQKLVGGVVCMTLRVGDLSACESGFYTIAPGLIDTSICGEGEGLQHRYGA
jgi:hypothetical protein